MIEQPTREVQELVRGKTADLVATFTNYLKDKTISGGRITLEAGQDEKGYAAFLKVARGASNAEYRLGSRVLLAYYDHEKDTYQLKRYGPVVGGRQDPFAVGSYRSVDELLRAVGEEVAKL